MTRCYVHVACCCTESPAVGAAWEPALSLGTCAAQQPPIPPTVALFANRSVSNLLQGPVQDYQLLVRLDELEAGGGGLLLLLLVLLRALAGMVLSFVQFTALLQCQLASQMFVCTQL